MMVFVAGFLYGGIVTSAALLTAYHAIYRPIGRRRKHG